MLRRIDFDSKIIPANGKEYTLAGELTINRFKVLEELEVEFYYGFTMKEMFEKLKMAFSDLDKGKPANAAVKVHNLMTGVADRIDKRENVMLRICSLFINQKDEDLNSWSDELAKEKIADWSAEGYAIDDFFSLAASLVPGFMKDYERILEGTLMEEEDQVSGQETKQ